MTSTPFNPSNGSRDRDHRRKLSERQYNHTIWPVIVLLQAEQELLKCFEVFRPFRTTGSSTAEAAYKATTLSTTPPDQRDWPLHRWTSRKLPGLWNGSKIEQFFDVKKNNEMKLRRWFFSMETIKDDTLWQTISWSLRSRMKEWLMWRVLWIFL